MTAPRRRLSAAARREQLIEVGRAEFARRGVTSTTVEEIAQAASVTKPVVYEHFGGKEGLYAVIVDRDTQRLLALLTESITAGAAPRAAFERSIVGLLTFIAENPDGFRLLCRDAPTWHTTGPLASLMSQVAEQIEDAFAQAMQAQGMDARHAPIYAQMIVGMSALTGDWWLEHGEEYTAEEVASHMVNFMWNGIKGLEPSPALVTTTIDVVAPAEDHSSPVMT